ncbi:MAG TPA: hypothetical protein VN672_09195 [Solirubrobacteraceae bacterium]|nr:hypothetical protein [Solirubrobacteraceae bacterium]
MAVVVVNEMQGGDQGFYDEVTSVVMPGGRLPDGCKAHIAGPVDGGWRVITVWDSDEQFQQFRTETLIPAIQAQGRDDVVAPRIDSRPVYRHITA